MEVLCIHHYPYKIRKQSRFSLQIQSDWLQGDWCEIYEMKYLLVHYHNSIENTYRSIETYFNFYYMYYNGIYFLWFTSTPVVCVTSPKIPDNISKKIVVFPFGIRSQRNNKYAQYTSTTTVLCRCIGMVEWWNRSQLYRVKNTLEPGILPPYRFIYLK